MNLVDIITIAVFACSTFLGFYKGFLKFSINLLYFISSFLLTMLLFPLVQEIGTEYISEPLYLNITSGVISYLLALIICSILNTQTINLIRSISGGIIDKILGIFAGASRGGIICLTAYSILAILSTESYIGSINHTELKQKIDKEKMPQWLQNSQIFSNLYKVSIDFIDLFPEEKVNYLLMQINTPSSTYKSKLQDIISTPQQKSASPANKIKQSPSDNPELENELKKILNNI